MTRPLVLHNGVLRRIRQAVRSAERHPIPLEVIRAAAVEHLEAGETDQHRPVMLADRKAGYERPPSQHVIIPFGFRASISFEQQPAGLVRHLSVSVDEGRDGRLPSFTHVRMIANAFGFLSWDSWWEEEFEPGRFAVNVIELVGGHST
jgi:hypothetical protein